MRKRKEDREIEGERHREREREIFPGKWDCKINKLYFSIVHK